MTFVDSRLFAVDSRLLAVDSRRLSPHWSQTENVLMRDDWFQSLTIAESKYPNCAFIVAGDFNRLDVTSIKDIST
jgi:hypothetical protein